ncbi:MAG TPA: ABC transporter substrate-binding protein [Candidatus Bathyarchaeia archaeon]|nr:ABC transporter substrate-binding protein [Candidatus Bathyarchaeia archaeon]
MSLNKRAVSRNVIAVAVIVIIVVAGAAAYFMSTQSSSPSASTSSTASVAASSSASMPQTLTVDEASAPTSLDPGTVIDNNGLELAQNTNLPLFFCLNAACITSQLLPVAGVSWAASANGLSYTIGLRNNVYYSDGDPFNAYVVWYNIYRNLAMNQGADFIFYQYFTLNSVTTGDVNSLNNPQNMPNATLLQIMQTPGNSVTVLNSTAVQFNLTNPFVAFMQTIETSPWVFVDPYTVEQHGGVVLNTPNSWMSVNGTTVGDGPYVSQIYILNQYDILVANTHYWAQNMTGSDTNIILQPAIIPKIIINYKTDELTRALDLQTGGVQGAIISFDDMNHVMSGCSACSIPNIGLSGTVEWVALDSMRAPLNNTLLRRAIVAAINVTQIQQTVFNGYVSPVVGPEPKGLLYYNDSISPPVYDVNMAKQLLTEAGYPNGQGLPAIDYYYYTSTYQALVAQLLKQDLAQVGITLNIHETSLANLISLQALPGNSTNAMTMFVINWTYYADFSAYEPIVDLSFGAFGNAHNQTVVNLILKSNTELNPTLRAADISDATQAVLQGASFIWLGQDIDVYDTGAGFGPTLFNHCVAGLWYNTAFNGVDFNSVYYSCAP